MDKEKSEVSEDDEMPKLEGRCVICNVSTHLKCQGCIKGGMPETEIPHYCDKKHQVMHWKSGHKLVCGAAKSTTGWKVTRDNNVNFGLPYFVATEELKPGHMLFTKNPLLMFPKVADRVDFQVWCTNMGPGFTGMVTTSEERKLWTCLGCYELIVYGELIMDPAVHGMKINKCPECEWPLHSNIVPGQPPSDCQDAHAMECKILTKNNLTWNVMKSEDQAVYYYLGLLRAVLLPLELKKALLKLPVFRPENLRCITTTDGAVDFVRRRCGLADRASEEELKRMYLIMFCNLLGPPGLFQSIRRKQAFTIYQGGSTGRILPHNCSPNCEAYVDPKTMAATFKTLRKVEKGEMLTMSYIGGSFGSPINERYNLFLQLFMEKHLESGTCRRCSSPTEGDTFLSAVKCPADKRSKQKKECQFLVPFPSPREEVTGPHDVFVWRCLCRTCPGTMKQTTVEQLVELIKGQVELAINGSDYLGLKSIISKNSEKTVHPNHSVMALAHMGLALMASKHTKNLNIYRNPDFKFNLHSKFLPDLEKAVDIMRNILPGRHHRFGEFLIVHTLLKMSELAEKVSSPRTKPGAQELDNQLESIIANLKECWIILKADPSFLPMDITRETTLKKLYANHLASELQKHMKKEVSEIRNFKLMCEKHCSTNVSLDIEEWEMTQRNWQHIPASEIPKLLKAIVTSNGEGLVPI